MWYTSTDDLFFFLSSHGGPMSRREAKGALGSWEVIEEKNDDLSFKRKK
jgi:hypothetical protein